MKSAFKLDNTAGVNQYIRHFDKRTQKIIARNVQTASDKRVRHSRNIGHKLNNTKSPEQQQYKISKTTDMT